MAVSETVSIIEDLVRKLGSIRIASEVQGIVESTLRSLKSTRVVVEQIKIAEGLIKKLVSTMEIGGIIHIATDHLHYYQQIYKIFSIIPGIALVMGNHSFLHEVLIPHSNYARKWLSEGKQIYTFEAMKI